MNTGLQTPTTSAAVKPKQAQPPQLAAAKRKPRDPNLPALTDRQKFMLGQVRAASKACKLLATKLDKGQDISPAAAVACSTLSAEYMSAT